jgi:Ser/Thr protein kinase RdoA (MazF antagonist)
MADYKHQEQDLRAAHQHLAHLKQEASATPVALVHHHQAALVAVQDLERQRVAGLIQHQAGEQLQSQQHQP